MSGDQRTHFDSRLYKFDPYFAGDRARTGRVGVNAQSFCGYREFVAVLRKYSMSYGYF